MSFVNEFVPEEDINKYRLREIWDKYHPFSKEGLNKSFRHSWTIDREKDVFIIPASTGREEFSNQTIWILWWKGVELSVTLRQSGSEKISEGTGLVVWELESIWKPQGCAINDREIIPVLKEALSAYGFYGIYRQLPDYKVGFKF